MGREAANDESESGRDDRNVSEVGPLAHVNGVDSDLRSSFDWF